MPLTAQDTGTKIKKTVAGRAIHADITRQPIISQQGTGYNPTNVPQVPATAIKNPYQRAPG